MELVSKGAFKFLGVREFVSKQGNKHYVAQFHDGKDVYEFFLQQMQLTQLPPQYSDVVLSFELSKVKNQMTNFREIPFVRVKNISPADKRLGVVNG